MMTYRFSTTLAAIVAMFSLAMSSLVVAQETQEQKYIVSIERIWDQAQHNAFTDLVTHGDHLYCTFREGTGHIPGLNGTIRVLHSARWTRLAERGLAGGAAHRPAQPELSIAPDGRLVVNMGASTYRGTKRLKVESRIGVFVQATARHSARRKRWSCRRKSRPALTGCGV